MAHKDGVDFTQDDFNATFGRVSREIVTDLWGQSRTDEQILAMEDEKERLYREIIEEDFPAMPGMKELLHDLVEDGFALAVGSSGPYENLQIVIRQLGAQSLLAATITARDVRRGKPDPEVFQLAAERIGLPTARCAVIEDAPLGITAGRAAGCATIGLASTGRMPEQLSEADLVVTSVDQITPAVMRELIDRHSH